MFPHTTAGILSVLDSCAASYSFPMLDNGYIYLAATRLAVFRSLTDWALTIEVFGFSPRAGLPDLWIETFGSLLTNRSEPHKYATPEAYQAYLERQPNNESHCVNPIADGGWIDGEFLAIDPPNVTIRNKAIPPPSFASYQAHGIELQTNKSPQVFEFCRWLAATQRDAVLATETEQRHHLPDSLTKIMQLDEWHHPDLVMDELPSETETFQRLAEVLVTGDLSRYKPNEAPNTHWSNWPDGGTL